MPYVERDNAQLYYEESGEGEPLLTLHGLSENTTYWSVAGMVAPLESAYRVVHIDLRAHGRSRVEGDPKGYDVETMADDVDAVADAIGLDRFHLLSHSTGGMIASRYAMRNNGRLRSLALTGSGSATSVVPGPPEVIRAAHEQLAGFFEGRDWDSLVPLMRAAGGPLLGGLNDHPDPDRVWAQADSMFRLGDPNSLAEFLRSFYTDPDPRVEELRTISCPTLVLVGEHDSTFFGFSELMAKEIPDARHVVFPNIGHMVAIEAPEDTAREVLSFLQEIPSD